MLTIPLRINPQEYLLFIALQDANIERIKAYDPAEVVPAKFGGEWKNLKLKEIHITYATADDERMITALCKEGKVKEALQHLCRGFKYKPTMGDHDGMYGSAIGGPVKPHPQ